MSPLRHAYVGDTPATASLPVLCVKVDGSPVPPGITPDANAGWARGTVGATLPTPGTRLTSRLTADRLCEDVFFRGTRFWVAINDQLANPWN
ncbi:hypothetical protein [Streptomyces rhizosphaericus]|uniref:Uncharacterized protein n=1 Tax=Streptomyces rhizosphaericus TaxID=114699 RepID=A0A6G4ANZ7_9ACTN|nr:hypothetical protein [Streptomyces rhizosphaericus]NEW74331.1 hypothetical protein [Streptomyces rhizosphaericus]